MKLIQLDYNVRSHNIILLTVIIIACETTAPSLQKKVFDKLSGTWQSEDGKSFERWTKNDNGTYRSVGYNIKGSDTSWNELAKIYRENDSWVF